MLILIPKWFIRYRFLNSLFLGVSVGSIFTLYRPLEPSIYSIGGIVLAIGMLIVARAYHYILNTLWFFRTILFVELVLLIAIVFFLLYRYNYQTALMMYVGYQITFVFGSYLLRAETLLLKSDMLLTKLDTSKQLGYLTGMGISYLFYTFLDFQGISTHQEQVYLLHYSLFVIEIAILFFIFKSFKYSNLIQ